MNQRPIDPIPSHPIAPFNQPTKHTKDEEQRGNIPHYTIDQHDRIDSPYYSQPESIQFDSIHALEFDSISTFDLSLNLPIPYPRHGADSKTEGGTVRTTNDTHVG